MNAFLPPILFAEDSPLDVEMTLDAFAEHRIANPVVVVADGEEALEYLQCRGRYADREPVRPILALLDLKMPRVNGLEVLRAIKEDPQLREIPVVMLTSSREEQDLVRSYRLGVNAYVVKPVAVPAFVEAVKRLGMFWAIYNSVPSGGRNPAIGAPGDVQ